MRGTLSSESLANLVAFTPSVDPSLFPILWVTLLSLGLSLATLYGVRLAGEKRAWDCSSSLS